MSKFKYIDQLEIIKQWYNDGKSYAEIVRLLGVTCSNKREIDKEAGCIRRLLRNQLGDIHGHPKSVITDEIKVKIHNLLNTGKAPIEIANILNIKYPTLFSYLHNQGLKFKPNPGNTHYFNKIDTYAKAYILGFIAADGALVPAKTGPTVTLTITVKYEDRAILEFIKSEIGNSHNLLEIKRPFGYDKTRIFHHVRLAFSTPEIVQDIMKYGIGPRKSLTMGNIIENIPIGFRDAFIIGYFDGDGSVTIREGLYPNSRGVMCADYSLYIQLRGTTAFFEGVCSHLGINKSHIHQGSSISALTFASKKDTYRLFQCYQYLPFYYKRKHDKFLARINHPSYDKYKQDQTISSSVG